MISATITLHRKDESIPLNLKTISERILQVCPELTALVIEQIEDKKDMKLVVVDEDSWIEKNTFKAIQETHNSENVNGTEVF